MIQADDPRLRTAEGWGELGAPEGATHWIGPSDEPWLKNTNGKYSTWNTKDQQWSNNYFFVSELLPGYSIIPRPVNKEITMLVMNTINDIPEQLLCVIRNSDVWKRTDLEYVFYDSDKEECIYSKHNNYGYCNFSYYTQFEFQRAKHLMKNKPELELESMTDWAGDPIKENMSIIPNYDPDEVAFNRGDDWYERYEFPPVGTECLVTLRDLPEDEAIIPEKVLIKGYYFIKSHPKQVWLETDNGRDFIYSITSITFHKMPITQEEARDLINEVFAEIQKWSIWPHLPTAQAVCEAMCGSGYRKPMSREKANFRLLTMTGDLCMTPDSSEKILDALGYKKLEAL